MWNCRKVRAMEESSDLDLPPLSRFNLPKGFPRERPLREAPFPTRKSELFARGLHFNPILYTAASSSDRSE